MILLSLILLSLIVLEMKYTIYNKFQLKGIIENNQNFHWKISKQNEIKKSGTEMKEIVPYFLTVEKRKERGRKIIHRSLHDHILLPCVACGGEPGDPMDELFFTARWHCMHHPKATCGRNTVKCHYNAPAMSQKEK